jgi:alkylation response protein AidB-like acyl-CoA dehydrogenase
VDFDDAPEDAAFRRRVRGWLEANCSPLDGAMPTLFWSMGTEEDIAKAKELQLRLAGAGLAGLTWPKEFGGQAAPLMHQVIFSQETAKFDLPITIFDVGIGLVAPTLMAHGTPEQQARYLTPILAGREIWCQLFSEPDAGSDLASLRTRAVHDGDEWVVTGQKVWSSGAHYADFGVMPARTDFDAPKHKGLSYFVVDMRTPGIEVRPLRQLTGDSHFNEVFLDGARLPASSMVGSVGEGWRVTQTTLMSERMLTTGFDLDVESLIALARKTAASRGCGVDDPILRAELAEVYTRAAIMRFISYRLLTAMARGEMPGPEGSIAKLSVSQLMKRASELSLLIRGAGGMIHANGDELAKAWEEIFLVSPAMRILGGSDEIQRNIIAERVLGLPREADQWRGRPFNEQPRTASASKGSR